MYALPQEVYKVALKHYQKHEAFFPLVGAVLEGTQRGEVYTDSLDEPRRFYVEHSFGFAQIFGESAPSFDVDMERHLLGGKSFSAPKVRLYTPSHPNFLTAAFCRPLRSFRQRFALPPASPRTDGTYLPQMEEISITSVTKENVHAVQTAFGVVDRFWPHADAFIQRSMAVVLWQQESPAAICYAAAVADGKAEIDVLTLPEYRGAGLGKMAAREFINSCHSHGVTPLWDCFTNNEGSMALCRSMGFVPLREEYPFYTIAR